MTRIMHQSGVNHRDYYLCHLLMDEPVTDTPTLHMIDLHRAQIRNSVPTRWLAKDLGGLLFSAFDKGLTRRDLLRFLRSYTDMDLRELLIRDTDLWRRVIKRAEQLYLQDHEMLPDHVVKLLDRGTEIS